MPFPLRFLTALAVCAAAVVAVAATAGANSIVYVKDGNVWLTSPDAAEQYQVTFDGNYSSPSQADDGTIVALHARQFVPADWNCAGLADRLLAAGGSEPDWGPAEVDMAQKPSPPAAVGAGAGAAKAPVKKAAGPGLAKVRLSPAQFRARAGAKLRFTLAGPAKVTLVVTRASGKAVNGSIRSAGKPGANTLRFKGRIGGHTLRPGRYRLTITARAMAGGSSAKATMAFRIVR